MIYFSSTDVTYSCRHLWVIASKFWMFLQKSIHGHIVPRLFKSREGVNGGQFEVSLV